MSNRSIKSTRALGAAVLLSLTAFAQQNDSIPPSMDSRLNEIIISSGQFNPQAVNKSIYSVKVISRDMIDRQGGNNLADVLNQVLNINIIPNASTGRTGMKLFGLDAQYFKILVDNIPLLNDEGLGNNSDLTQINLDDIMQVEIVEGAMGVDYGANAVSGIINIITKKDSQHRWEFSPTLQEETVGNEYDLRSKGRHIQSFKVGHKISDNLYSSVNLTHNNFKGFWDDRLGEFHSKNDGLRGQHWLPKDQYNAKALLNYNNDHYRVYYRFEYFDEKIEKYNNEVSSNYDPATEIFNPTANDKLFKTTRIYNALNASGRFKEAFNFDVTFSFQQQERKVEDYYYRIYSDEKYNEQQFKVESRQGFYSKGSVSNFISKDSYDFQLGYEISDLSGFSSSVFHDYGNADVSKRVGSYDLFGSAEIVLTDRLSFRPGYRLMLSNFIDPHHSASVSVKYLFNKDYELRANFGMSPRLPSFDELYTYFVDSNHNLQGNSNLKAESGKTFFLHLKKNYLVNNKIEVDNSISFRAMQVDNRIEQVIVNRSPLEYSYENVDQYSNYGLTFSNSTQMGNLHFGMGWSLAASSRNMAGAPEEVTHFVFNNQLNANIGYRLPSTDTYFSVFWKYTGSDVNYVRSTDIAGNDTFELEHFSSYSWLDATVRQSFLNKKLIATLGARNLLNVKAIESTARTGGPHSSAGTAETLAYGTSVFLKMQYIFNF